MGKKKPEAMVIAAAEVKPAVTGTDMKSIMKPKKVQCFSSIDNRITRFQKI